MKVLRARLFRNGGSQAVRLPKECRFPDEVELRVRREGSRVVLELVDEWPADFRSCLGAWRGEIPRPLQPELAELRDPFG